tara:strand:- start:16 stop:336 length:321 start_codon:yes stop_codon:yes gene_type:complete
MSYTVFTREVIFNDLIQFNDAVSTLKIITEKSSSAFGEVAIIANKELSKLEFVYNSTNYFDEESFKYHICQAFLFSDNLYYDDGLKLKELAYREHFIEFNEHEVMI